LGIDLARSFWIGDRPSDVAPARRLGGKAYLVLTGQGESHVAAARTLGVPVVADLAAAVTQILAATAR
jgi:histidinol phosphatase-like enzyme